MWLFLEQERLKSHFNKFLYKIWQILRSKVEYLRQFVQLPNVELCAVCVLRCAEAINI